MLKQCLNVKLKKKNMNHKATKVKEIIVILIQQISQSTSNKVSILEIQTKILQNNHFTNKFAKCI